jgi:hypothetical protein
MIEMMQSELAELQRMGLVTYSVYARCVRYLERHPDEFDPSVTGPLSSTDAVDMLLQVAS